MKIDIILKITPDVLSSSMDNENKALAGHQGTQFDVLSQYRRIIYGIKKYFI